jgi:DNA-binding transcriptional ArsR family regulator
VWVNARNYNGRQSEVTKAAQHLEELFDATLAAARAGVESGEEGGDSVFSVVAAVSTPAEASRRAEARERAAAVRSEPIGTDRLGRSYFWDGSSLLVENTAESNDLEYLCLYESARDFAQLIEFLDDGVHEDRLLKLWLRSHRSCFESDGGGLGSREDGVGSWVNVERAAQPVNQHTDDTAYAEHIALLLRQQGQQLRDTLLMLPRAMCVRQAIQALMCQLAPTGSVGGGKNQHAALRTYILEVEAALTESGALSAWGALQGKDWRRETQGALTASAVGLQMSRLREAGLEEIAVFKGREMTRAQWMKMLSKAAKGRVFIPMPQQEVTYLSRGHREHVEKYGKQPWDDGPRSIVKLCCGGELCQVEAVKYYAGRDEGGFPLAVLQLRSLQVASADVEGAGGAGPGGAGAGGNSGAGAGRTPSPVISNGGSGGMAGGGQEVDGQVFYVTIHGGIVALADLLIDSAVYTRSKLPFREGEEVRMWFSDESGGGGEYYSGTVVQQAPGENGDLWESVTVRWEDGEEMQVGVSNVCTWRMESLES